MTVPKPLYIAPLAWLRPFVLLALALLSLASTAWAGREQRSVVISITLEPDSLDPTTSPTSAIGEIVHYNVFEGLVKIQENGTVAPLLAQSWQVDEQGKRYTFALRRGVIFHDGSVFDARAVRFTLERALAPHSPNKAKKALFDNIARFETPDPHTLVLHLHHADGNLLFRLGESPAAILHPASAAQAASHPIGTGPYQFVAWKKGWGVTLTKFAAYRYASQIKIAHATLRFLPSAVTQTELVDKVDVFYNLATHDTRRFRFNQNYQVLTGPSNGKAMLAINHRRPPLNDVRVRQALTHALDREAFIRQVLQGQGQPIGSHFSPTDTGYVHLSSVYPYDPARARALLKEAGVALPLALSITLPPAVYAHAGGPVVVAALAQVGITATLVPVTWAQWLDGTFKGDFDLTLINHVEPLDYQIYADPGYYFGYDSAEFRDLVLRHGASTQPRERQRLFMAMQRHLAADAVNAWIFTPQVSTVARKGLRGLWMNYPISVHDIAALSWD